VDAVPLSTVAADYVEISVGVELGALPGRKPASQKAQATSLTAIFI